MKIDDFGHYKKENKKITMVTCYDYTSAKILSNSSVDCILVGDSVAMVLHGFETTVSATLDMIASSIAAVRRGTPHSFIIGDLPLLSYRKNKTANVNAVTRLIQAGANAVKLEGADGNLKLIKHLVESGIPVMGHIGLTPQLIHQLGGYKVQGKTHTAAVKLQKDCQALQNAGCFALVLECVPRALAKQISESLSIPTIGIGAGPDTDGQVLVWQDLLGLNTAFKAKFVKHFLNGEALFHQAIDEYTEAVQHGDFPGDEHCY
jgi:3-methyl-2-oxobutanoate hydroxymethyltransferase